MSFKFVSFLVGVFLLPMNAHCGDNSINARGHKKSTPISQSFDLTQVDRLEGLGFERSSGGLVYGGENNQELYSQSYCFINRDNFPSRPVKIERCVIVVEALLGRKSDGEPIFQDEDALLIELNGYELFDQGDTGCFSSVHPKYSVFSLGHWKWRKPPLVGGYAHSLIRAWEVDPISKKFIEISVKTVRCEINEDRD